MHRLRVEDLAEARRIDHVREHDGRRASAANRFSSRPLCDRCGRRRRLASCRLELRIVREHLALELAQPRARLEPELLGESGTRLAENVEGVRLPPRAVEREHQLRAQALAERVLCDQDPQLRNDIPFLTLAEIGVEPVLEHLYAELLEPLRLPP